LQTFETEMLAEEENFGSLARINRELIGKAEAIDAQQRIVRPAGQQRLQLGKSVAAVGVAEEDRELVADQLAATAGEDGRQAGWSSTRGTTG